MLPYDIMLLIATNFNSTVTVIIEGGNYVKKALCTSCPFVFDISLFVFCL